MKKYLILLVTVLIMASCTNRNSFLVTGTLKPSDKKMIYISRVNVDEIIPVDSAQIRNNGSFRFRIKAEEPDFYQLGYSTGDFVTLLAAPGEKINLRFDSERLAEKYDVTGSEGSGQVRILDLKLLETKAKLDSISDLYGKAGNESDAGDDAAAAGVCGAVVVVHAEAHER